MNSQNHRIDLINSKIFKIGSLTGDATDVFVRFKFSGDVMSLVIPVFIGLMLNRESNNELRTLFELKQVYLLRTSVK